MITKNPLNGLKFIVTIPAYLETSLTESLVSLFSCTPPSAAVEVIIVINWPENESPENIKTSYEIINIVEDWINKHNADWISFHCIVLPGVPVKKAGVGYARKTAMDEAIRRFILARQEDGIILSFDADSLCDPNYFVRIESHFLFYPRIDGCSIYFEHPLEGKDFSPDIYLGITQYELHLRYYLHSLRYSGFPNAFYTLGSAFAVRARSYCLQGGMNTRKAGEDFYFLQKLFDLGSFTELNSTRVIPSPRPSHRVPFGTGAAIESFIKGNELLTSINPLAIYALAGFFNKLPLLHDASKEDMIFVLKEVDDPIVSFLESINFERVMREINNNSSDYLSFRKRFFRYFNMFRIFKFMIFAKKYYSDIAVTEGAGMFLKKTGSMANITPDARDLLTIFRKMDRVSISQL